MTRIAKRLIEKRAIEGRLERSKEAMQIFRENISRAFFFFLPEINNKGPEVDACLFQEW